MEIYEVGKLCKGVSFSYLVFSPIFFLIFSLCYWTHDCRIRSSSNYWTRDNEDIEKITRKGIEKR